MTGRTTFVSQTPLLEKKMIYGWNQKGKNEANEESQRRGKEDDGETGEKRSRILEK